MSFNFEMGNLDLFNFSVPKIQPPQPQYTQPTYMSGPIPDNATLPDPDNPIPNNPEDEDPWDNPVDREPNLDPTYEILPQFRSDGAYTQSDIDRVVDLINSGELSIEDASTRYQTDPSVIQENLDYINRTHHTPPTVGDVTDDDSDGTPNTGGGIPDDDEPPWIEEGETGDNFYDDFPVPDSGIFKGMTPEEMEDLVNNVFGGQGGNEPPNYGDDGTGTGDGTGGNTGGDDGIGGQDDSTDQDNTNDDSEVPDFGIPVPPRTNEPEPEPEPDVPGFDDILDAIGGIGAGASAIGGIVNIENSNDAIRDAANIQAQANQQSFLDQLQGINPNYVGPYGTQTTTEIPGARFPRPTVTTELSDEQKAIFDSQNRLKTELGSLSEDQLGRVGGAFGTDVDTSGFIGRHRPDGSGLFDYSGIDTGGLSERSVMPGVTGRNAITDSIIAREQPRFQRAEEQMRNKLLTEGHNAGTLGHQEATDEFSRARNDFNLAAQQAGAREQSRLFGLESDLRSQGLREQEAQRFGDAANRAQQVDEQLRYGGFASDERARELQESLALRNVPINELNALRSGTSPGIPQFQGYQGANLQTPDHIGAGMAQAQNYQNNAAGLFDLAGTAFDWWNSRRSQSPANALPQGNAPASSWDSFYGF